MLKAVRFDEDKHQDIITFILNYKDNKGRINESEGIRFLMQLGYDALHNKLTHSSQEEIKTDIKQDLVNEILDTVYQSKRQEHIDIDSLKKELLNDIMLQINNQTLSSLNNIVDKLSNIQPTIIQQPIISPEQQFTKINASNTDSKPKPKIEIPADTNPLLANLLANSNR